MLQEQASRPSLGGSDVEDPEDTGSDAPLYEAVGRRIPRAQRAAAARACCWHAASISLNFALMLLTMTFNIGVCAAVVVGLAMGRTMRTGQQAQLRRARSSAAYQSSGAELCH